MTRFAIAVALFLAAAVGCTQDPPPRAAAVDVSGTVTGVDGKPVKDALLTFQPTDAKQLPASFTLKADGKYNVKLIPGKYTYMFEGKLAGVPAKYHQNEAAHAVEVPLTGGSVDIKLEK